jgi:drug/metabolite transporter (DMT)-like permease
LAIGLVGVVCFSASLPFTQVAVREFGVIFPSFGRGVVAAVLAACVLRITRTPRPSRASLPRLAMVVAGVAVGFPAFSGLALQHAPAGHGAVVIGLLPAATAGWSVFRNGARPSAGFWCWAGLGAGAIVVLALWRGTADIALGDLFLLGAIASAAVGYSEGAVLSRELGGWQTISWAVVMALPLTVPLTLIGMGPVGFDEPATAWISLAYLGAVSMFLAFFAWYAGLAMGGIARVSQVQLVQPMLSLTWAALFLGEQLDIVTGVVALVVLLSVGGSRRSVIAPPSHDVLVAAPSP